MRSLVLLLTLTSAVFSQDLGMFRGDPEHQGIYSGAGAPSFSRVQWKFRTDGRVKSSPVVAGGTLYIGSDDRNLYAIDAESGTLKWKFKTGSRVTSSPAVLKDVVYFGSFDGNFYAVDTNSGKQKWVFKTAGERRYAGKHLHGAAPDGETQPDPFDFFLSSPVVVNDAVYFGSGDGNVYALNPTDGAVKWKFHTGDVVHSSPAVSNGTVFIGSWDTYFYALDASTGKERWRFKTGDDPETHNQIGIQSSPLVVDQMVYFGCRDSNLYALDSHSGEKKWAFNNKGSWVIGSPVAKDGKLYFATSDSGLFRAVDAKTGAEIYTLNLIWPLFSSPAIAGNTLYIGSEEGKLIAIDLSTQQPVWTFQTDGSKENGPALTKPDGKPKYEAAFADGFYDSMVIGVDKMQSVGMVLSSPVIAGNVVYFGSTDKNIYALE
ncbi:MAG TPA: PQQ-binding-like beta-propeller repeat protein [Terriglobales bacterium]|nr:PQQ-binding-like beta-propeller repeat protein [Terriglobales bacterium]